MAFLIVFLMVIGRAYRSISLNGSAPSNWSVGRSVFHGRVPCDLNGDGVIETSGGEENGCSTPRKQYPGTPPDKPRTFFTGLAITSSLAGVSFWYRSWGRGYGS